MAKKPTKPTDNVINLAAASAAGAHSSGYLAVFDGKARRAAFDALHEAGTHLVVMRPDKRPALFGWLKTPADIAIIQMHAAKGGPVAIVPWSLDSVVLDLDEGGGEGEDMRAAVERIELAVGARAWAICNSKTPGRAHLWFRADKAHGNPHWRCGDAAGEVRGVKGAIICWQPEVLAGALANRATAEPAHLDKLIKEAATFNRQLGQAGRRNREGRNDKLNTACWLAGINDSKVAYDQAIDKARKDGLPDAEIKATAQSGWKTGQAERKEKGLGGDLAYTNDGLAKGLAGIGVELRLNTRSKRREIKLGKSKPWKDCDDEILGWLWSKLAKTYVHLSDKDIAQPWRMRGVIRDDEFGAFMHEHRYDPWVDGYLAHLPAWDSIPRIGRLLSDLFDADETPINYWASAQLFLGPLARTFQPGCRLRQSVVLIGPEFIGKSALLAELFPRDLRSLCHADSLKLNDTAQRQTESILGRVLVEVADFAGLRRADIESLKAFMTRLDDGVRLSFRRDAYPIDRSCVIVATTNEKTPLPNDPHGNTRFVPVRVPRGVNIEIYMVAHRDQLWAEALAIIEANPKALDIWHDNGAPEDLVNLIRDAEYQGQRASMPRQWLDDAKALAGDARNADESTEDWLITRLKQDDKYTLNEIRDKFEQEHKRPPWDRSITNGLLALGWTGPHRERKGQKMRRFWHGPDYTKLL